MRIFTVDVAAAALGVERKRLDNLLARHALPDAGVSAERGPRRQGRRRRLTSDAVLQLAVALALGRDYGIPLARAVRLAATLRRDGRHESAGALALTLDRAALERSLAQRLAVALEGVREPRRGRPPARARDPMRRR